MTEVKLSDDPAAREWHLDKRIPVAILLGLGVQFGGLVWWGAQLSARVDMLERSDRITADDHERIVRIEATLNAVDARLERMERMDEGRGR